HNIFKENEKMYIKNFISNFQNQNQKITIISEVLNASNKKGLAMKTTKTLRSKGIDVQKWGNYSEAVETSMIIDRTGNWNNASYISKILRKPVVFSKKNNSRFVDVSIILGEDFN
ncbi:LytR C-terminal domain-containing protein, partial [bacterium]